MIRYKSYWDVLDSFCKLEDEIYKKYIYYLSIKNFKTAKEYKKEYKKIMKIRKIYEKFLDK